MADRFSRIIALLYEIVAEQGVMQLRNGPLTILIYNRIRHWAGRFLARATVPPRRRENTPRAPRKPVAPHPRPEETRVGTGVLADAPNLPRGRGWLVKLMQPTAFSVSQLMALLSEPEVTALLLARPQLARLLRPLCHALSMPPLPCLAAPRRTPAPEAENPDTANPDAANPDAGTDPAGAPAHPPRCRPRKLPFRRNEDLLFRLRMGTPLPEF